MIYSIDGLAHMSEKVVNWFQIVFLRNDLQREMVKVQGADSCELISNCIFT